MSFPLAQLAVYLIVAVTDVGTAIYNRYVLDLDMNIGYASHIAGLGARTNQFISY